MRVAAPGARPILILGATGALGRHLARACDYRGLAYMLTDRRALDLGSAASIGRALDDIQPWAVINAAGFVRVEEAESDALACLEANTFGVERLSAATRARNLPLIGFSADLVFDGAKLTPYLEDDAPSPLNIYGLSKALGEAAVLENPAGLIIRTAAFFSPYDPHNFAQEVVRALSRGKPFVAADDLWISPTYIPDLAEAVLDLVIEGETGVRHLANGGCVTWAGFAHILAEALELDAALVRAQPAKALGLTALRPSNVSLASNRPGPMPNLDTAVARYSAAVRPILLDAPVRTPRDATPKPPVDNSFAQTDRDLGKAEA